MPDYMTFQNIYQAVERIATLDGQDQMVKDVVNQVYLNEIMVCDELYPLFWMVKMDDSQKSVTEGTVTAITKASPGVLTVTAHGLVTDDVISVYSIVGMTELNERTFRVVKVDANSFSLKDMEGNAIDTTNYTTYTSGGTVVHRGVKLATTSIDVENIISAGWADEKKMTTITTEELAENTRWFDESTAVPDRFQHIKQFDGSGTETNFLLWFQGANSAEVLRYWAEVRASRLSADADVPLLPHKFHDALVSGSVTRLVESGVQVENAVVWPNIYLAQLEAIKTYNRNWWKRHEIENREGDYLL